MQPAESCCAASSYVTSLKALFFIKIALKLSYFCKKMQNFQALGAPPPDPRASGGWGLCPQTPSLGQLGASPPDPQNSPPLRISGYALGNLYRARNKFKI